MCSIPKAVLSQYQYHEAESPVPQCSIDINNQSTIEDRISILDKPLEHYSCHYSDYQAHIFEANLL